MAHFNQLIFLIANYFAGTDLTERERYFVFIDVYGQYSVYQQSISNGLDYDSDLERVNADLSNLTGAWLNGVFDPEGDIFVREDIKSCLENTPPPIVENVWIMETFLQDLYWQYEPIERLPLVNHKVVSFYSCMGGIGRTTSLLLTAIALAQKGKKVVLLDFDLESPSLFQYFSEDQLPKYGLLDYLVDRKVLEVDDPTVSIQNYFKPISIFCDFGQSGSEIFVVPACGTELLSRPKDYLRALMHTSLDLFIYRQERVTPIDDLFTQIDNLIHPDYYLIDNCSGIRQISGITMNRYSGLSLIFSTCNRADAFGLNLVLPAIKAYGSPYMLIRARASADEASSSRERANFLHEAYNAVCYADETYSIDTRIFETSGEHFPFELPERPELAHVSTLQGLLSVFPIVEKEYGALAEEIIRKLPPSEPFDSLKHLRLAKKKAKDENLVAALRYAYRDEDPAKAEEIIQKILREES